MNKTIQVTTGDLINHSKSISNLALAVGNLGSKNYSAVTKMENACSCMRVAGIYVSANHLIRQFTDLVDVLQKGASKALDCATAYREADDKLILTFNDWFNNVVVGDATQGTCVMESNVPPLELAEYLDKVSDAEYAKLNQIWTDVCNSEDPLNEFIKRLNELPANDPLRQIGADQIKISKSISGLSAISITDNSGNAMVLFAGTNGFGDLGDIANDGLIALGKMSPQEVEALNIIAELSKTHSNITVSGYSLGGYLATAAALRFPTVTKCVAFDPPGRYDVIFQKFFNSDAWSRITTYESRGGTVSAVGAASGNMIKLNVDDNWIGPIIHNHQIDKIYDALGGDNELRNVWDVGYLDLVNNGNA